MLLTYILLIASRIKPNLETKLDNGIANRGLPPNAIRNDEDGDSKVR